MPPAGDDYEPTMGAVQLLCHRRLRTVQKRVAKIQKAEEKLAAGGEIDDQQRELTDGKPLTMALLDEFTKLSQEIEKAVEEDRLTVLREERAKVAAKAERSQARRAVAGGGDRPIAEAGKNDSVPPAAPDGTVAKKERKRSGKKDREAPTDGAAPAQTPAPAAPADAKPPSSDADANPAAKPRRERGGRGKNKNKAESGDAAPAAVAPPAAAPAPGITSQGGAIVPNGGGPPGVERRAALDPRGSYGAPGVPVGVDGITVTFGSLGVGGGGGGVASAPGQSQERKRPDAAALLDRRGAPADPVAPVEINLADYGFDDEYGAPDDLVDDNDYYPAPPPQQQQQQQRAQGKPRRREESAGAGTKRGGGERTRGGGERKEAGGRGRGGKEAGGGRGGGRGGRGGGRGQI